MADKYMPPVSIDISLFWQIINFIILIFIFKAKFHKPISKFIESRRVKIESELKTAEEDREAANKAKLESEELVKKAKNEANEILIRAERKADERKDKIIKEANSQREKTLKSAEIEVQKMKEQARVELQQEVTSLAVKLAEKMITEKLDTTLENTLLDDFIEGVEDKRC